MFEKVEKEIFNLINEASKGKGVNGKLSCSLNEEMSSLRGSLTIDGKELSNEIDSFRVMKLLRSIKLEPSAIDISPIYHCEIVAEDGNISFNYFRENDCYQELSKIKRGTDDAFPTFVLKRRFDKELIENLVDNDIEYSIFCYVGALLKEGKSPKNSLHNLYCVTDWLMDSKNGGLDQYFNRKKSTLSIDQQRSIFNRVMSGLVEMKCTQGAELFSKALNIYDDHSSKPQTIGDRIIGSFINISERKKDKLHKHFFEICYEISECLVSYVRRNASNFKEQ